MKLADSGEGQGVSEEGRRNWSRTNDEVSVGNKEVCTSRECCTMLCNDRWYYRNERDVDRSERGGMLQLRVCWARGKWTGMCGGGGDSRELRIADFQ